MLYHTFTWYYNIHTKNWHGENTDTKYSSNAMILLQILLKCQFYVHIENIGSKIDWTIIQKHVHQWTSICLTGHIYNFKLSICVINDNLSLWKIIMWNESATTSTRAKPYWNNKLVKYLSFLVFGDTEIMFSNKNEIRFESLEILKCCSITERKSFWILGEDKLWSLFCPCKAMQGHCRAPSKKFEKIILKMWKNISKSHKHTKHLNLKHWRKCENIIVNKLTKNQTMYKYLRM